MDDPATLLGNLEIEGVKMVLEKWLDSYVAKGTITKQAEGEMVTGGEDFFKMLIEIAAPKLGSAT
jgi:hypothetical protein